MAEKLTTEAREATIRARAYELWQTEGHPDSRHLEHWLKAEKELEEESSEGWETDNGENRKDTLQKVEHDRTQVDGGNDALSDGEQKRPGGARPKTLKLFSEAG